MIMDENKWAGIVEARLSASGYHVFDGGKVIIAVALKEAFFAQDALWNCVCGKTALSERRITLRDAARATCSLCLLAAGAGPGEPATNPENPPPKHNKNGKRWHGDTAGMMCLASGIWDLFEETPI